MKFFVYGLNYKYYMQDLSILLFLDCDLSFYSHMFYQIYDKCYWLHDIIYLLY